jgi:energy-coupling factor transport system permease protein
MDPRLRIGLVAAVGTLALCLDRPLSLGVLALATWAAALTRPRSAGWRLRLLAALLLLAWSTALSQALFWEGQPRTPIHLGLTFYREGFLHGLVQSLRFGAVLGAGVWLSTGTPPDRLIAALLALRLPFGLALMGATAMRFVPLVTEEVLAVRQARARRGRLIWRRSPAAWLREEAALLRPIAARALRRARTLAESLEARGFHPTAPRAVREPLRFRRSDWLIGVGAGLGTSAIVLARLLYVAYGVEVYYSPGLRPLYAAVRAWM